MTVLPRFNHAYAHLTVAIYRPLLTPWAATTAVQILASVLALRATAPAKPQKERTPTIDRLAGLWARRAERRRTSSEGAIDATDWSGALIPSGASHDDPGGVRAGLILFPDAVQSVKHPASRIKGTPAGGFNPLLEIGVPLAGLRSLPVNVAPGASLISDSEEFRKNREALAKLLRDAAALAARGKITLGKAMRAALDSAEARSVAALLPPEADWQELLSPVGVVHYIRQVYFHGTEGYGPIEQVFTVAPLETLEVVEESSRRQVFEEVNEFGVDTVSETAIENHNIDEISDKVASMVQRDMSAAISASVRDVVGVWEVSGEADLSISTQTSRETATRRLKEFTKKASERLSKSLRVTTRRITETTSSRANRRVLKNETPQPVSYALRRVMRRVRVKVQELGPRLVWQFYLEDPGRGLARSRYVSFRESESVAVPEIPPGVRPRPEGGYESGSTTSGIVQMTSPSDYRSATIVLPAGNDRVITSLTVNAISSVEPLKRRDTPPSLRNDIHSPVIFDHSTNTYTIRVAIEPGDAENLRLDYTFRWEPSPQVLAEWEGERQAAVHSLTEEALEKQFQRQRTLITERSKVRPRPGADLRREERLEVMSQITGILYPGGIPPSPVEINAFERLFDVEEMFFYPHPAWWKPRTAAQLGRDPYEITGESEPAPMGASLGWLLQTDGDPRRNEFLNSPWVRVCLPIQAAREDEALAWLAEHVEGATGYDTAAAPLAQILAAIRQARTNERQLGMRGPDWVTVDATPGAPAEPLTPEAVYPVVDEFEVTVPTEGFMFDVVSA